MKEAKSANLNIDLAIVGGGGSGLMAAIAAAKAGVKNISILEKVSILGGNTGISHGLFAVNSPAQKRLGIRISADEVFRDKMLYANWRIDPRIVRTVIDRSPYLIQWLESQGLRFEYIIRFISEKGGPQTFHKFNADPTQGIGAKLVSALIKECRELGIQFILDTTVKKILTEKGKGIGGVLAVAKDQELTVMAKSVIIATGGFAGNKVLLDKYFPYHGNVANISLPQMTGDGLLMAEEAGAFIDNQMVILLTGPGSGELSTGLLFRRPEMIFVNKNGERFMDETLGIDHVDAAGNALSRQPEKTCYGLIDSGILREIIRRKEILTGLEQDFGRNGDWLNELEISLGKEAQESKIGKSETWEGLAAWMGIDANALKGTLERYNCYCDQGYDADFLKDQKALRSQREPPFYAIPGQQSFDTTLGGIRINHHAEVLDKRSIPMKGLYAAGDVATGCESVSYNHRYPGSALAFALIFGQIAGESSARYILSQQ